jgi:hypothetical protein
MLSALRAGRHFTPQENSWYSFLLEAESTSVWLEGLGQLEKSNGLIGVRSRDLPARSKVPQPTTLPLLTYLLFTTHLRLNTDSETTRNTQFHRAANIPAHISATVAVYLRHAQW